MPKLWNDTIEAHRHDVRAAIVATGARLVAGHGLRAVTMQQIAKEAGIGRATLYKYFPDVESILRAWHRREVGDHLDRLAGIASGAGDAVERLQMVLEAYAAMSRGGRGHIEAGLEALLHRDADVAKAGKRVRALVGGLIEEGARQGRFRTDVAAGELASYCIGAMGAAAVASSRAAVSRLVAVTLAGLRPPP